MMRSTVFGGAAGVQGREDGMAGLRRGSWPSGSSHNPASAQQDHVRRLPQAERIRGDIVRRIDPHLAPG
jgi:hypothetical protein